MIGDTNIDQQDYKLSNKDSWNFMSESEKKAFERWLDDTFSNMPEPEEGAF